MTIEAVRFFGDHTRCALFLNLARTSLLNLRQWSDNTDLTSGQRRINITGGNIIDVRFFEDNDYIDIFAASGVENFFYFQYKQRGLSGFKTEYYFKPLEKSIDVLPVSAMDYFGSGYHPSLPTERLWSNDYRGVSLATSKKRGSVAWTDGDGLIISWNANARRYSLGNQSNSPGGFGVIGDRTKLYCNGSEIVDHDYVISGAGFNKVNGQLYVVTSENTGSFGNLDEHYATIRLSKYKASYDQNSGIFSVIESSRIDISLGAALFSLGDGFHFNQACSEGVGLGIIVYQLNIIHPASMINALAEISIGSIPASEIGDNSYVGHITHDLTNTTMSLSKLNNGSAYLTTTNIWEPPVNGSDSASRSASVNSAAIDQVFDGSNKMYLAVDIHEASDKPVYLRFDIERLTNNSAYAINRTQVFTSTQIGSSNFDTIETADKTKVSSGSANVDSSLVLRYQTKDLVTVNESIQLTALKHSFSYSMNSSFGSVETNDFLNGFYSEVINADYSGTLAATFERMYQLTGFNLIDLRKGIFSYHYVECVPENSAPSVTDSDTEQYTYAGTMTNPDVTPTVTETGAHNDLSIQMRVDLNYYARTIDFSGDIATLSDQTQQLSSLTAFSYVFVSKLDVFIYDPINNTHTDPIELSAPLISEPIQFSHSSVPSGLFAFVSFGPGHSYDNAFSDVGQLSSFSYRLPGQLSMIYNDIHFMVGNNHDYKFEFYHDIDDSFSAIYQRLSFDDIFDQQHMRLIVSASQSSNLTNSSRNNYQKNFYQKIYTNFEPLDKSIMVNDFDGAVHNQDQTDVNSRIYITNATIN